MPPDPNVSATASLQRDLSGPTTICPKQKNLSCMAKRHTNLKQLTESFERTII